MPYAKPDALVSTAWLADHLDAPDVRVVDASWFFPQEGRDPRAEHAKLRIPGAVFFDIDEIADTTSHLPHMLPAPEKFSSRVRRLGLGDGVKIVVATHKAQMADLAMYRFVGIEPTEPSTACSASSCSTPPWPATCSA